MTRAEMLDWFHYAVNPDLAGSRYLDHDGLESSLRHAAFCGVIRGCE
jgi:hypothetical protein